MIRSVLLPAIFAVFLATSVRAEDPVDFSKLQLRFVDTVFIPNTDKPFTGTFELSEHDGRLQLHCKAGKISLMEAFMQNGQRLISLPLAPSGTKPVVDAIRKPGNGNQWTIQDRQHVHGSARYWYPNGQKSFDGTYHNGTEDGTHKHWYQNGQLSEVTQWKNGRLLTYRGWLADSSTNRFSHLVNGTGKIGRQLPGETDVRYEYFLHGQRTNAPPVVAKPKPTSIKRPSPRPKTLKEARERRKEDMSKLPIATINTTDQPVFLSDYDQKMSAAIQSRWYQLIENRPLPEGKVTVRYRLIHDGRIFHVETVSTEVNDIFTVICQMAIKDPSPYPRWPDKMRDELDADHRDISITFNY